MIHRHSAEQVQAYYDSPALNNTIIKEIIDPYKGMEHVVANFDSLMRKEDEPYYEEQEHYLIGSAVDGYFSYGEEVHNSKYFFSNLRKKPGPSSMSILKMVFDMVKATNKVEDILEPSHYREQFYNAIEAHQYFNNRRKDKWEDDTRYGTVIKDNGVPYWNTLIEAGDRIILSETQNTLINSIINSFANHPHTAWIFEDSADIHIIYQMPLYFKYSGIDCKVLPDIMIVNHKKKMFFRLDMKTFGKFITKFRENVKKLRYDVQGAWYELGILANIPRISALVGKDISGYYKPDFAFIAESTKKPGTPLIFPMTKGLLQIGEQGSSALNLQGYKQAVAIYKHWMDKQFSLEAIAKDINGLFHINENFEYNNPII